MWPRPSVRPSVFCPTGNVRRLHLRCTREVPMRLLILFPVLVLLRIDTHAPLPSHRNSLPALPYVLVCTHASHRFTGRRAEGTRRGTAFSSPGADVPHGASDSLSVCGWPEHHPVHLPHPLRRLHWREDRCPCRHYHHVQQQRQLLGAVGQLEVELSSPSSGSHPHRRHRGTPAHPLLARVRSPVAHGSVWRRASAARERAQRVLQRRPRGQGPLLPAEAAASQLLREWQSRITHSSSFWVPLACRAG
ncbi:hypothetical protein, conserved [Leishmania donovani]|uniref:Uncharacterized protein n=1 Tax=Leishmania donovani TaxID=5661 RepID=E9B787_LEIDO|nr:hypothetical protein, conserved [Leishmania donovani]CBZ31110.1 hypothetical protein, conserved [Leishmania donovani]